VYSVTDDKNVSYRGVKNQSMLKWNALGANPENQLSSDVTAASAVGESDEAPVHHTLVFDLDKYATGQLDLAPKQSTGSQNAKESHEFFYVLAGTAEVAINEDVFVLKRGCHFHVPPRNTFSIKNPNTSGYLSVLFFRATELFDADES